MPSSPEAVNFRVEGEPVSKHRARAKVRRKRDGSLYCKLVTDDETSAQEMAVGLAFKAAYPGREPLPAGTRIDVWCVFAEGPRQRQQWQDVDNLGKLVLDALNGVAWQDDKDVRSVSMDVHRGSDVPHTWVSIVWEAL